jgi:hypothetical protein
MASEELIYSAVLVNELSISPSAYGIMKCELPSTVLRLECKQETALFKLRLTIVQVCKAWYCIAISTLWSHIRLDSRYFRMSVNPPWPDISNSIPVTPLLPLFENLRILTCSEDVDILAGEFFICQDMLAITITDDFAPIPKLIDAFRCVHTISIKCNSPYIPPNADFGRADLLLPNLVNLVLTKSGQPVVRFITNSWNMPRLRNISISYRRWQLGFCCPGKLLLKYRLVLQRVEFYSPTNGLTLRKTEMPEL